MGRIKKPVILPALMVISLLYSSCGHAAQPVEVRLAAGGKSLYQVVTGAEATETVRQAAAELADYLGRISGASFEVVTGDGSSGLAVGLPGDFPGLAVKPDFHPERPTGREDYLLRTHPKGIYLLGATETAASHAVWDFLYRLGYRQFFPGEHWEVVPRLPEVKIALDTQQRPSYNVRTMPSATSRASSGPEAFGDKEALESWSRRNRLARGWRGLGGHIYGFIIRARKAEFEAHPEYRAMVDGKRGGSSKLCISNPALRKLVVDYAMEQLARDTTADSISMEPSDGGGFCECPECARLGSITDQVVTLANEVAEAVSKTYPGKYVSILAYNFHTAPPNIRLHPAIVVTICAGQLTGNWKPEELFDAWAAKGANANKAGFAVFEYYSNIVGNPYMPARLRISDIDYLRRSITDFHRRGARRLNSGVAYSNGTVSLGAYMASRMLWDVTEAERVQELYRDFLDKAFPGAQQPMDRFMRLTYRFDAEDARLPVTGDTVGRMYRALLEARPLAADAAARRRIDDLVLYTRYVELYLAAGAATDRRAEACGEMLRHVWRMRREMMVNTVGIFSHPDKALPEAEAHWRVPAGKNPWKTGEPYTDEEIVSMLKDGVANTRVGEYQTKAFSVDLVPAAKVLHFEEKPPGTYNFGLPTGGRRVFYTWVDKAPGEIKLQVAGGFVWPKRASNVEITLFSDKAVSDAADFVVTRDSSVPPDQQVHNVVLRTPYTGLHRIEVEGGSAGTTVEPGSEGMVFTVQAGPTECFPNRFVWEGWFYVPKGTKAISFHVAESSGEILSGDGKPVFSFRRPYLTEKGVAPAATAAGFHTISVPAGQDGCLWKLDRARGPWLLLNVPPYMARRPAELLLPREVVEADK